jgi:hypothetical protein
MLDRKRWHRFAILFVAAVSCEPGGEQAVTTSATETVSPPSYLDAPGSSTSGNVLVKWGPSPTSGVDQYELQETTDGESWTPAYSGPGLSIDLRYVVALSVTYRARACIRSTNSCSGFTAPVTVTITPTFPDYLTNSCDPIPITIPAQQNVGAIAGEAGVSGGAATYRIPIAAPPGRRGMQPSFALAYHSRGGSEVAGVGFSISGTSRIHRCPRTTAQDGTTANVDFTIEDALCLDGERLVPSSGSNGSSGSTYRTEIDRFARITLNGDSNWITSGFVVEDKSGLIHRYGAVELSGGVPLNWWLAQSEDRQGNRIDYTYAWIGLSPGGQFVLSEVRYTGSVSAPGDRSILFTYEERPDKSTRWLAGRLMRSTHRLKAITSKVGSQIVRRYELGYSTSRATTRSLLTSVKECTSDPCTAATSLPVTTFTYQDEAPVFAEQPIPGGDGERVLVYVASDYEGDGTRDWIRREYEHPWGSSDAYVELFLSSEVENGAPPRPIEGTPCERGIETAYGGFPGWGNTDFDQDGRADLVGIREAGSRPVPQVLPPDRSASTMSIGRSSRRAIW